jgi:hypothetical protein
MTPGGELLPTKLQQRYLSEGLVSLPQSLNQEFDKLGSQGRVAFEER